MTKLTTLLKRMGGVVIACLLLTLVVTPAADAVICGFEPASMTSHVTDDAALADVAGDEHGPADIDACFHGHCHHASPLIGAQILALDTLPVAQAHLVPALAGLPPSLAPDRLNKPPRA